MCKKKVFVIVGPGWSESLVRDVIFEEEYEYDFFIATKDYFGMQAKVMTAADEVWCFGDCSDITLYRHAKVNNYDCWQMG